jgi:putative FmdB family regulatory protein
VNSAVPLYEYSCPQCGRFEAIRKFSDAPLLVCPTCGREVSRLISAPAIQFKGTGWYVTDYARKSSGGDGDSSASSKSKEAKDTNGKGSKDASSSSPTVASKDASSSGSPSK